MGQDLMRPVPLASFKRHAAAVSVRAEFRRKGHSIHFADQTSRPSKPRDEAPAEALKASSRRPHHSSCFCRSSMVFHNSNITSMSTLLKKSTRWPGVSADLLKIQMGYGILWLCNLRILLGESGGSPLAAALTKGEKGHVHLICFWSLVRLRQSDQIWTLHPTCWETFLTPLPARSLCLILSHHEWLILENIYIILYIYNIIYIYIVYLYFI